jgi:hypothetical protein
MAASAQEVLNYRGNAALGANDAGVVSKLVPADTDGMMRLLEDVRRTNTLWNVKLWEQKIKDRDDTADLLASQDIDVDVLDEDRPLLEAKIKEVEALYQRNPDPQSDPKVWSRMRQLNREFKEMKVSAKNRAVTVGKMRQEYADNPDEEYRSQIAKQIGEGISGGILHQVTPLQKMQDWDNDIFTKGEVKETPGEAVQDANGLWKQTTNVHTPIKSFFDPFIVNSIEGAKKNTPDKMEALSRFIKQDPRFNSPEWLGRMNDRLEEINLLEGQKDGDAYYLRPIGRENPETKQLELDATGTELTRALSAYMNYKNETQTKYSKDLQTQVLTKAKTATETARQGQLAASARERDAAAGEHRANTASIKAKTPAELAKLWSEVDENRATAGKTTEETEQLRDASRGVATDYVTTVEAVTRSPFKPVKELVGVKAPPEKITEWLRNQYKVNINADWQATKIPITNQTVRRMLAYPAKNDKGQPVMVLPTEMWAYKAPGGDNNTLHFVGLDKNSEVRNGADLNGAMTNLATYQHYISGQQGDLNQVLGGTRRYVSSLANTGNAQGVDFGALQSRTVIINNSGQDGGVNVPDAVKGMTPGTTGDGNIFYRDAAGNFFDATGKPITE